MGETITIRTGSSTDVIKVIERGPQGPQGAAGAGLTTLTQTGDMLYRDASGGQRLGIGTAGQILKVNAGATAPEWGAAPASGVSSVNGQTGAVTVAAVSHSHQPSDIFCDAADVADTTLSSGEPNGIYFRDGSDNGKAIYKSAQGYAIWWDEGEEEWVLGNVPQTAKYYIGTGDTTYPWQATSWSLGPQGSGETPVVDQALLSNFQRDAAQDSVSTRTPKTGNASSTEVVLGSDTRLTNSRTPTSHTHGNITNAGLVGTTSGLPLKTGTGGVVEAGSFGTSAGTFCQGNDARLSDARTPAAHAASHRAGRAAVAASYKGKGDNDTFAEQVIITANTAGTAGNNITLSFDGVDDVDAALAAWNSANPSNQATLFDGEGNQIPDDGDELTLSGGVAAIASGSDPFANINQNLGTTDSPEFLGIYVGNGATDAYNDAEVTIMSGSVALTMENPDGDQVSMRWFSPATTDTGNHWGFGCDTLGSNANNFFIWDFINNRPALWANGDTGNVVFGGEYAEGTLPAKVQVIGISPSTATLLGLDNKTAGAVAMKIRAAVSQSANLSEWLDSSGNALLSVNSSGNLVLHDNVGGANTATFTASSQLTGNRSYNVPDASGTLALQGAITTSGLTQATARILGRTTASTGAVEEITIGSGLSLSAGQLSATGGSGGGEVRSDFVSPYTYTGLANAGTSNSTASWTIRRSEFDAGGSFVATLTASAVSWNNRLTASYA